MARLTYILIASLFLISCGNQDLPPATQIGNLYGDWSLNKVEVIDNTTNDVLSEEDFTNSEYTITDLNVSYGVIDPGAPDIQGNYDLRKLNNHFYFMWFEASQEQFNINNLIDNNMTLEKQEITTSGGTTTNISTICYFTKLGN